MQSMTMRWKERIEYRHRRRCLYVESLSTTDTQNNVPLTESMSCPGTAGDIPGQNIPVIEVPWTAYVEDEASNVELFR